MGWGKEDSITAPAQLLHLFISASNLNYGQLLFKPLSYLLGYNINNVNSF